MIWSQVWLLPNPEYGWKSADTPIVGVPALARVLAALKRAGVYEVHIDDAAGINRSTVDAWASRWDLPRLVWPSEAEVDLPLPVHTSPMLALRWGVIFAPKLLQWFEQSLDPAKKSCTCAATSDGRAFMLSGWFRQGGARMWAVGPSSGDLSTDVETAADEARAAAAPVIESGANSELATLIVPEEVLCRPVAGLTVPDGDRALLAMVGKATDRWHVVWVRNWSFGGLRWLAAHRVTPNQVTLLGFLVAVLACLLLAGGHYWSGILGALLLYGSWVLDCMDGTLARLTFAESAFGQKLDTVLGHVTNLAIFAALIWAVYGQDRWWKVGLSAILMLGGILMAYRVSEKEKKLRPAAGGKKSLAGFARFLDKINHRDYAVVILVLALINGFKWFLWISLVGVQFFWMAHLWLIRQHQRAKSAE